MIHSPYFGRYQAWYADIVAVQEYKDINRTYTDVAQTLSHYSSLSPRTDVYSMVAVFTSVSEMRRVFRETR